MAIQRITGRIIEDGAIEVADVADNAVTTAKIADGNVTSAKIDTVANTQVTGVMTTTQVADSAITTDKLADANVTTAKIATTVPLGTKNLIINGDMRIAQRGTSSAGVTTSGVYLIDRFNISGNGYGTWTLSQDTDVPSGQGFNKSFKLDCTTANASLGASNHMVIVQRIEGQNLQHLKYGTSSAEKLTVSFWVKSNKTGTYTNEFYAADGPRHINTEFTINSADTWEKKTITIDGDTSGVIDNDNGAGLEWVLWLAAGTDFTSGTLQTSWDSANNTDRASSSNVNLADSTSNYINITGVQLEVGDAATPFEHRPYDMELARCQRYFQKFDGSNCIDGQFYSSTVARFHMQLSPTMRSTPTGSWSGTLTASVEEVGVAFRDPTGYSVNTGSNHSYTFNGTGMSGATASKQAMFRGNIIELSLSAEL